MPRAVDLAVRAVTHDPVLHASDLLSEIHAGYDATIGERVTFADG